MNDQIIRFRFLEKKPPLKTFDDVQTLLSQGKKREVKLLLRDNAWPINSTIRAQLWPAICSQHQVGKSMLEGYYWDMVNQVHFPIKSIQNHVLPLKLNGNAALILNTMNCFSSMIMAFFLSKEESL